MSARDFPVAGSDREHLPLEAFLLLEHKRSAWLLE